jgi:hypothetical protein
LRLHIEIVVHSPPVGKSTRYRFPSFGESTSAILAPGIHGWIYVAWFPWADISCPAFPSVAGTSTPSTIHCHIRCSILHRRWQAAADGCVCPEGPYPHTHTSGSVEFTANAPFGFCQPTQRNTALIRIASAWPERPPEAISPNWWPPPTTVRDLKAMAAGTAFRAKFKPLRRTTEFWTYRGRYADPTSHRPSRREAFFAAPRRKNRIYTAKPVRFFIEGFAAPATCAWRKR